MTPIAKHVWEHKKEVLPHVAIIRVDADGQARTVAEISLPRHHGFLEGIVSAAPGICAAFDAQLAAVSGPTTEGGEP